MAEEWEKYAILKSQFRRRSSTEFTGKEFAQVIQATQVPRLLSELGERKVDPNEVKKTMNLVDPSNSGKLNFDQYAQVCTKLVKDPTHSSFAMEFKTFSDFETP